MLYKDIDDEVEDENKTASALKAAAAAERRARIMKQMAAQQSTFMKVNHSIPPSIDTNNKNWVWSYPHVDRQIR